MYIYIYIYIYIYMLHGRWKPFPPREPSGGTDLLTVRRRAAGPIYVLFGALKASFRM